MKLRTKIITGFAIIMMLLTVMGTISLLQFNASSNGFTQYRNLARDTNLAGRIQANMLMVRMNVKDFIITSNETDYEEYFKYYEKMSSFLAEAQNDIEKPERAAIIDDIENVAMDYQMNFDKVHKYRNERDNHVKNYLDIRGPEMENDLTEILESAEKDEDMDAVFYTSLTMKHLLLARLYVTKFLESNLASHITRVNDEFDKMETNIRLLDSILVNQKSRNYLSDVKNAKSIYIEHFNDITSIIIQRNEIITSKLDVYGPQIAGWIEDVKLSIKAEQDELGLQLQKENKRAFLIIIVLFISAVILSFLIAALTIRSTLNQLGADPGELQQIAEEIASGELKESSSDNDPALGGVFLSMIEMKKKLTEMVSSVLSGTEQIAEASEQLASGNLDLSNRTEQQASALEETSSAIAEMNSSIKSNADNTGTADQLSREAVAKTEEGSQAVSKMIDSITEINESSNRIANIIEVITNIAFQTNLLALNASIEAARAGEQGKGFAVVAVEVRRLAKRTDKAAEEITSIITNSNQKVEEGVSIANSAGTVLEEINASVRKVTAIVSEISAASLEQLSSADQIDKTLESLDENTQKNAALVEEAASSTEELSAQAQELNSLMDFFKLSSSDRTGFISSGKKKTKTRLLGEPPGKEKKPLPGNGRKPYVPQNRSEAYETFSDLVDEGEFDEF